MGRRKGKRGRTDCKATSKSTAGEEMQRQEQEEGASVEIVEETMETCGAVEEAAVVKKRVNYGESAAGLMAEKPPSKLIYPANITSLTPDFLMVRAAGDTPYFTIEVPPDPRSNDQSVFLDTSLQQMLYDPIISDGDPMDNLSSIWIIRTASGMPPDEDSDGPAPGPYIISNFVTKKARLMTGGIVPFGRGTEYSVEVLDQGRRDVHIFTLGFRNFRYSITTVVKDGKTAYLMPTEAPTSSRETPPRNNLIVAVVSPRPRNPYIFRIRGTSLQFSVCGEPKFQWK